MNNLFAQSRSHWVRYDRYEIKIGKDGKRYITPEKVRRPGLSGEAGRWKRCLLTAPAPGCKVIIFHILSADRMSLCEEAPHEAETFRLH